MGKITKGNAVFNFDRIAINNIPDIKRITFKNTKSADVLVIGFKDRIEFQEFLKDIYKNNVKNFTCDLDRTNLTNMIVHQTTADDKMFNSILDKLDCSAINLKETEDRMTVRFFIYYKGQRFTHQIYVNLQAYLGRIKNYQGSNIPTPMDILSHYSADKQGVADGYTFFCDTFGYDKHNGASKQVYNNCLKSVTKLDAVFDAKDYQHIGQLCENY